LKLTLSLDKETIEFAHNLARAADDSISNMVRGFLRSARKNAEEARPVNSIVRKLHGATRLHPIPDKQVMREKLLKKHRA